MLLWANMTTTLLVLGGIWVTLSFLFCLGLCAAAAKPIPEFEGGEGYIEPKCHAMEEMGDAVLCAR